MAAIFGCVFGGAVFWSAGSHSVVAISGLGAVWLAVGIYDRVLGSWWLGAAAGGAKADGRYLTVSHTAINSGQLLGDRFLRTLAAAPGCNHGDLCWT